MFFLIMKIVVYVKFFLNIVHYSRKKIIIVIYFLLIEAFRLNNVWGIIFSNQKVKNFPN